MEFNSNIRLKVENEFDRPLYESFRVALIYNMYDTLMRMIHGLIAFSKADWKNLCRLRLGRLKMRIGVIDLYSLRQW